ncbi:MAG: DUF4395 domain-containing protein [Anaerolineae bacterium]|nr:DUF4395 domain-containing protein [Anaerolineae bacterium]
MNQEELIIVDHTALKVNQAVIIIASISAFLTDMPWLAALVGVVMGVGTFFRLPGFFPIYQILLRFGWASPDPLPDNPEPHRFAQGIGATVIAVGISALYSGASLVGWSLVWMVIILAALNLFAGFCVGCALYYWLNRIQTPGFVKKPPRGIFPGMRPKVSSEDDS